MKSNDLVIVRNYLKVIDAQMAKTTLDLSGIDSTIRTDDCGGWRPWLHMGTGVQLMVRREDAEKADEVLKEVEECKPQGGEI